MLQNTQRKRGGKVNLVVLIQNIKAIAQRLIVDSYIKTVVEKPAIIWSLITYKQKIIGAESYKGLDTRKIILEGMSAGILVEVYGSSQNYLVLRFNDLSWGFNMKKENQK